MALSDHQLFDDEIEFDDEQAIDQVRSSGVCVLRRVFGDHEIADARSAVLGHRHLMKNTRPSPTSRHLAGFHRFPALEPLHRLITGNQRTREFLIKVLAPEIRTIGLSDITINRSQQWHKDLLRGPFRHHMNCENPCEQHHGKLFKVILYLQDSSSLHVVPGSHRHDIPLESDEAAVPHEHETVLEVEAKAGDAVVIDICTTHRGSPEESFVSLSESDPAKILVSTVFASTSCEFADRMEFGNADRLASWHRRGI